LIRKVGEGSYGTVWLALDSFHRWVAIKLVQRQPGRERLFEREFSGLDLYDRMARHDGLIRVFKPARNDVEGYFYYAMEVADDANTGLPPPQPVRGDLGAAQSIAAAYEPLTLDRLLRGKGRLTPTQALSWAESLANALQHLHAHCAVHRDIKPSNILVVGGRPRLADIGLLTDSGSNPRSIAGTVGYIPVQGANDHSGDIYALGLVIYQMATGRHLSEFPDEAADYGRLSPEEADALNELQAVYDRAANADVTCRQPSAEDLAAELKLASQGELRQFRQGQLTAASRRVRREQVARRVRWAVASVVAVLLATLTGVLVFWRQSELGARAQIAELGELRFSRLGLRINGWSRLERNRIQEAQGKIDDLHVESYAILAMAGLDAIETGRWSAEATSHVAFHPSEPIALVAGLGESACRIIRPEDSVQFLPVTGPAHAFWTDSGQPRFLVLRDGVPTVVDAWTGSEHMQLEPLPTGESVRSPSLPVWAVSPGGRYAVIACASATRSITVVWDLSSSRILASHESQATCLTMSPDDSLLAVGKEDGSVEVLSLPRLERTQALPQVAGRSRIQALAFARDLSVPLGTTHRNTQWCLAVGDHGAGVVVWRLHSATVQANCRGALWEVSSLAFLPDGITLVSGGRLGLRFWDSTTGELLLGTHEPGDDTVGLGVSADGNWVLAGSIPDAPTARTLVWRMEYGHGIDSLRGLRSAPRLIRFSADARWVAALDDNWRLGIWDTWQRRLNAVVEGSAASYADTAAICFDPRGGRMALACNGTVTLLNITNGLSLYSWVIPKGESDGIACIDSGDFVHAVCRRVPEQGGKRRWILHHLRVGEPARVLAFQEGEDVDCLHIALGPSLKMLALECIGSRKATHLRLVDARTGRDLWCRPVASPFDWETPRLDPLGNWLLMSEGTPEMRLTRLADGKFVRPQPRAISVSPDTRWITYTEELRRLRPSVVEGFQTSLLLLGLDAPDHPLPLGSDSVVISYSTQFSPDGTSIIWGDERGVLSFARIDDLVRDLESLGTRPGRLPRK